jgi:hypothetical protein
MRPILAVAGNLLREISRKRSTPFLVLLVAGSAFILPHVGGGGGTLRTRLQLAVTYGVGFPAFLLALATIATASGMAREIENRRIQVVVTKPIAAWQILLGRLVGMVIGNAVLLGLVLGALAIDVSFISGSEAGTKEDPVRQEPGDPVRPGAPEKVFLARASLHAVVPPPPEGAVRAYVAALERDAHASKGLSAADLEVRARRALRLLRVAPGGSGEILFPGLPPGAARARDEEVIVRYQVYSLRPWELPRVDLDWDVLYPISAPAPGDEPVCTVRARQVLHGVPQGVALPAQAFSGDRWIRLRVRNPSPGDPGATLILDPEKVEVLYVHGRFWPNALRALALVLAQLALLASIGLLGGCVCTFPTSVFLGLFLYLTALSAGFLRETFALFADGSRGEGLIGRLEGWVVSFGSAVLSVLPDFATLDPVGRLAAGRAIGTAEMLGETAWMVGFEAAVALAAGAWILGRRELGK